MTEVMAWSFSRLNTFEKCPKQFKLKYIDKVFPPFDDAAPHLIHGRKAHALMELILKAKNTDLLSDEFKAVLPILEALIASDSLTVEGQRAFDCKLNEVSWFDSDNKKKGKGKVWVRVIFDVLCISINGVLIIIDWKTGKISTNKDQLRLFAGAGMAIFPEVDKVLTAYIWLDHPTAKPLIAEYTRLDFDSIWQEFGDRAELIQLCIESGNWEPKPCAFNCKWCEATCVQCEFTDNYGG